MLNVDSIHHVQEYGSEISNWKPPRSLDGEILERPVRMHTANQKNRRGRVVQIMEADCWHTSRFAMRFKTTHEVTWANRRTNARLEHEAHAKHAARGFRCTGEHVKTSKK